jgi:CheY-like chemotaxis protein
MQVSAFLRIQKSKGTGLGLSVSKSIVELHHGHVGCVSEEHQGAEFFLVLPMQVRLLEVTSSLSSSDENGRAFASSPPPPPPPQQQHALSIVVIPSADIVSVATPVPAVALTTTPMSTPRVLVVEDSVPNRKLLCALLTRLHCKVMSAENGQVCVDMVLPHIAHPSLVPPSQPYLPLPPPDLFDIVLMDNSMPLLDGMTATRILRLHGVTIPIVGVTGNALEEDLQAFREAGANQVLTKPIAVTQLERLLRPLVRARRSSISPAPPARSEKQF